MAKRWVLGIEIGGTKLQLGVGSGNGSLVALERLCVDPTRNATGVLEQIVRNVEIRCEPRDIPEVLEVDVTNLGVHEVLHISDIPPNEKIEILEDANAVIATVGIVKEEEVVVAPVEGEVPAEPEVIGKGKKEEEGEAPAEEEKEKK